MSIQLYLSQCITIGGGGFGDGAMKSGEGFWGQGLINNHVNQG